MSGLVDSSPPGGSIVRPMPPPGPYLDTNGQLVDPKTTPPPDGSLVTMPSGATFHPSDISHDQPLPLPSHSGHSAVLPNSIPGEQIAAMPKDIGGQSNPIKDAWRDEWLAAGYPPAAVAGASRRVGVESGWNVHALGDYDEYGNPTSFGLTQHHGDRAVKFANYLKNNNVDMNDPVALARADAKFSISEFNGGDSIAAKHKAELMNPNISEQEGYGIFTSSFERPAGSPGSEETNLRSNALGPFNAGASAVLGRLMGDIDRQGKNYESAIAEGKDLRSVARAAMAKWELSSENPPKDMRENWNQWAGAAIGLAMLGGFFGKNHTAAINAAGEMLQAANQADVRAYDIAYKRWKDHNDNGLKLIELLHGEARDVINDAKNSYDMTVTKLATLGTMYQLQQHLDPASVENIEKNLRVQQLTTQITEAQKKDADEQKIRAAKGEAIAAQEKQELSQHPEWGGTVPAWRHLEIVNEAERLGKGQVFKPSTVQTIAVMGPNGQLIKQAGAYALPDGSWRWAGTNEPVEVPLGGALNPMGKGAQGVSEPLSDEALTSMAERVLAGDHTAAVGLGYGTVGANNRTKLNNKVAELAKERGWSGEKIAAKQAEMAGIRAEFQAVGRRIASIETAGKEAAKLMPQVLQTSEKVNRTEFSDINRILEAGLRRTGDPSIVQFGIAINSFINAYGRALSPTGVATVSDKDHARDLLQEAWSKGQINAAMDQLQIEINAALAAPDEVWEDVIARVSGPRGPEFQKSQGGAGARSTALPTDLPAATGLKEGAQAKDESGKVVAVIRNGQWGVP